MPPTVSVILPTYNRAKTLERAIESVLNQTFSDFELIIIDDGSTDETSAVLSKYSGLSNVRLISRLHRGCSVARNLGIGISQGRYVAFQDSDDEWFPTKLEKAVAMLEGTGPEYGVFYSDMLRVESDGSSARLKSPDVEQGRLINEDTLDYEVANIGIQSAVIKRESFEKVGCFDEALPRFIDLELFIRLSDHFRFVHCKETLIKYYAMEGISTNTLALVAARLYILRKYRNRLKQPKHHLAQQYLYIARALEENGEKYGNITFTLKGLLTSPRHPRIRTEAFYALRVMRRDALARLVAASDNRLQRIRNIVRLFIPKMAERRRSHRQAHE